MKRNLLSMILLVPLALFTLASLGCSKPAEVKSGTATSASFGPGVGVNEDGEPLDNGLARVD